MFSNSSSLRRAVWGVVLATTCGVSALAQRAVDVAYALVALTTPSPVNTAAALPTSTTIFDVGDTCYLEVWTTDLGALNTGVTSAYVDLSWPAPLGLAGSVTHVAPFTLFASGAVSSGLVDDLGGSDATLSGQGLAPLWARVALVPLQITAAGDLPLTLALASTPTACYGRGTIPPSDITLAGVTLNPNDDVAVALVVSNAVSGPDQVTTLPASIACVPAGAQFYVEVWISDIGSVNTGITSAYVDVGWDSGAATGLSLSHRPPFTLFPSGNLAAGLADELGGSDSTLTGQGVQPSWARVAAVELHADTPGPLTFDTAPAATGIAAYGRGLIPPTDIVFQAVSVDIAPECDITTVAAVCAGTTGLTASVPGGNPGTTYAWTVTNGTLVSGQGTSSIVYDADGAGSLTVSVVATGTGACTCTDSAVVTVFALPPATASNGGPYCAGDTIALSASGGTSYEWSGPAGFTSSAQNPTLPNATTANAGVYTVTVTDANACTATATTTVVVNPLPTPSASNTGPYCTGDTIALSASGGTTYQWTGPGGFTSTAQNPTIAGATPANGGTYTVTVTNAAGCTATATTTVIVNANPTATASNGGPYCAGDTIALTASGGTTYQWSGPAGFTSSAQNPTIPACTVANAGTYTVVVTDSNGCSATATTTVAVHATPIATAGNTGPYCVGETIALSASGGVAYAWTGPASFTSSAQNPTIPGATLANAGTYTVVVTDANGCSAAATTTVIVNATPAATAGNGGPYCTGDTIALFASGGATYLWTGPAGFTSNQQNPTIPGATSANAGVYNVTVTTAGGCSASASTTVVVNALPTASAGNGGPYCVGDTIALTAAGGTTYAWIGPGGFTSSDQNPTIPNATPASAGVYSVVVTDANGCSATATTTVVIHPAPVAGASNGGPYCVGETVLLLAAPGGLSYLWSGPNGFSSTLLNPSIPNAGPANAGVYTVVVTDPNTGCSASASTTVIVDAPPAATASNNGPVCAGESLALSAEPGGLTYAWTGPGGFTSSDQNPVISGATTANAGTYTVVVTDPATGCSAAATTTAVVHPLPDPVISAEPGDYLCHSIVVTLDAGGGYASYLWSTGETTQTITVTAPGIYTVTVTSVAGCSASAAFEVVPGTGARGDTNCDGTVNFKDIDPFVAALGGEAVWAAFLGGSPACDYLCVADTNKDGVVTFRDIDPFVACLGGNCP